MNYKVIPVFAVVALAACSQSNTDKLAVLAGKQMAADCEYNIPTHREIVAMNAQKAYDTYGDYAVRVRQNWNSEQSFCEQVSRVVGE